MQPREHIAVHTAPTPYSPFPVVRTSVVAVAAVFNDLMGWEFSYTDNGSAHLDSIVASEVFDEVVGILGIVVHLVSFIKASTQQARAAFPSLLTTVAEFHTASTTSKISVPRYPILNSVRGTSYVTWKHPAVNSTMVRQFGHCFHPLLFATLSSLSRLLSRGQLPE